MSKINLITSSIRAAVVTSIIGSSTTFAFAQQSLESAVEVELQQQQKVEQQEESEIERVEITGSRIKSSTLEGVSPVTIITADELMKKGFATAYDALKDLTANTGSTQGAEMGASGGFTPNAQTVSLRGLGNNQVLVLVNGRRVADYPAPYNGASNFVNLSSIPAAAIANIQILTAGASAIYGSDAVAGVMNIITKKDVEDTTFSAKAGTTTEGGGDEVRFQLVSGYSTDNFTVTGALEYQKQDPIYSADRSFMDSVDDGPAGHNFLDRGIVIVDKMVELGFYQDDEDTEDIDESWDLYRDPTAARCRASGSGYEYTSRTNNTDDEDEDNDVFFGNYCGTDLSGTRSIRNERETVSAYVSAEYDISEDTTLYTDVMYAQQDAFLRGSFHFVNAPIIEYRPDGDGNMDPLQDLDEEWAGAEMWDYHTDQRLFAAHELGFQHSTIEDTSLQVNLGLKGIVFDDYDWDLGFSRSENTNDKYSQHLKEEGVMNTYLGQLGDTEYWGVENYTGEGSNDLYDPITAQMRDALVGTQVTTADSFSNTVTAVLTGPVPYIELPAGDVYFALVGEWNKQGYDIELDDRTLNTQGNGWWGLTGTEGGGERERYAIGGELKIPVFEGFMATLAGRYDQYDDDTTDVGGRFSPQVGLEYRPTDDLLLRASWGQSFRAPDMHRVFATEGGYYTVAADLSTCEDQFYDNQKDESGEWLDEDDIEKFDPEEFGHCNGQSAKGSSTGSKVLEEEEGTNIGVGFVWDATNNLSITADWYSIEIEQVVMGESINGILEIDYYCKQRQTTDEDADNYYPYEQNDRPDIVPGSQQCLENADKITRKEGAFAGEVIDTVSTTHINVAKQTTEGIDAKVNYRYESNYGDWNFNLAWTHTLDSSYQIDDESEELHTRDLWWNHTARSTMNGAVTWSQNDLSLTFSGRRIGSIPIWNPPAEFSDEDSYYHEKVQRLDPYYTFNLTSVYHWNDSLAVKGQIVNIFNPEPPKDETNVSWPYYNGGVYGGAAIGRTVYAELTYVF